MRQHLSEACLGMPLQVTGAGSLFKVNATSCEIKDYRDSLTADKEWERIASLAMLNEGFMVTQSMQGCVSTETTAYEVNSFIDVFSTLLHH